MSATLVETTFEGFACLVVETEHLTLKVLPELGAKVISLRWKPTDHELLWRHPSRSLQMPPYGATFTDYDISGWDECFPSISEVYYPDGPWKGTIVPDHGELWALPWQWAWEDGLLRMGVQSVRFGYHFERTFDFTDTVADANSARIGIDYRVTNPTPFPFKSLWSMHPFFTVSPSSRVLLPANSGVITDSSKDERFGPYLSRHSWPHAQDAAGEQVDLSLMGPRHQGHVEKFFSTPLPEGWSALYDGDSEQFLVFTFDPRQTPHMGICQIRDGWSQVEAAFTTILEPCSGWPDRLDVAIERGAHQVIPPHGEQRWPVTLQIGQGKEALQNAIGHRSVSA